MIDTRASGFAFISDSFMQIYDLPLTFLSTPIVFEIFDGQPVVSGNMIHKTILNLSIGIHCKVIALLVTRLGHYPIILGIS